MHSIRKLFKPRSPPPSTTLSLRPNFEVQIQRPLIKPIAWKGACLSDLPAELIFVILGLLSLRDVSAFALASRGCYKVATRILNRSVKIALQDVPSYNKAIDHDDPRIRYIQSIQLGRLDKPGYAEKWLISHEWFSFLLSFSALHELEMCGGTFIRGWAGLDELAAIFGNRLTKLKLKLSPPLESPDENIPLKARFECLKSLDLSYVRQGIIPERDARNFFHDIQSRCEHLVLLNLRFVVTAWNPQGFPLFTITSSETPYFPSLRIFGLHLMDARPVIFTQEEMKNFATFLRRHSNTLLSLVLPTWKVVSVPSPIPNTNEQDWIPLILNLVSFSGSVEIADYMLPMTTRQQQIPISCCTSLQEFSIDVHGNRISDCPYIPFEDQLPEDTQADARQWPFKNIRRLTITRPSPTIDFCSIPLYCPHLEELHIQFTKRPDTLHIKWEEQRMIMVERMSDIRTVTVEIIDGLVTEYRIVRDSQGKHEGPEGKIRFQVVSTTDLTHSPPYNYWTNQ
ncbi:hypothetical protein C8Q75DRAFT_776113 [Abortiporus biennis]|nr:hypothetical protein C8Q75DRAFT_776113 [Abortiporus biennis]